jgi:hypothetical protein
MNLRDLKIAKKAAPTEQELQKRALQQWANRVESEAHWAQILRDAPSSESRAELERVVGPLLTFRRTFLCTTPDCDSGQPGIWQPTLVIRPPGVDTQAWVPIELLLCETCKLDASLKDFLTESIWAQVLDQFTDPTTPPPVKRLTTLEWSRVQ